MSFVKDLLFATMKGNHEKQADATGEEFRAELKEQEAKPVGAGGVSDWNDLTGKPFGEYSTPTGGDTLTIGIDTETDIIFDVDEIAYSRVSLSVPNLDNMTEPAIFTAVLDGETYSLPCGIEPITENGSAIITPYIMIITEADVGVDVGGIVLPAAGTYILSEMYAAMGEHDALQITIPGCACFPSKTIKKLERKYLDLPGVVKLYTDGSTVYLYATEDTSNTENRLSKAELEKIINSGAVIHVRAWATDSNAKVVYEWGYPLTFDIDSSTIYGRLRTSIGNNGSTYFTKEY